MKIGVIGSTGQFGTDLMKKFGTEYEVVGFDHNDLEVSDFKSLSVLKEHYLDVIVNTAAFHKTDQCEEEPTKAFLVNTLGARNVALISKEIGVKPKLAGILVGNDPASELYLNIKRRTSAEIGIDSILVNLEQDTSKEVLLDEIKKLNEDESIHGIILQLPLPTQPLQELLQLLLRQPQLLVLPPPLLQGIHTPPILCVTHPWTWVQTLANQELYLHQAPIAPSLARQIYNSLHEVG